VHEENAQDDRSCLIVARDSFSLSLEASSDDCHVALAGKAMDRTVFIYSSDHGYHSGQWGVAYCKMLPCVPAVLPDLLVSSFAPAALLIPFVERLLIGGKQ
jgi:hypothetical protein